MSVSAITEPTDGGGKEVSMWLSGWTVAVLVFMTIRTGWYCCSWECC